MRGLLSNMAAGAVAEIGNGLVDRAMRLRDEQREWLRHQRELEAKE